LSEMWLISALRLLKPIPEIWHLAAEELGRSGRWAASWERHGVRVLPPATILGIPVPSSLPESLQRPNSPSPVPPPPGGAIDWRNPPKPQELLLPPLPETETTLPVDDAVLHRVKVGAWLKNSKLKTETRLMMMQGFSDYWSSLQPELLRNAKAQRCTVEQLIDDIADAIAEPPLPPLPPDTRGERDDRIVRLRREGLTQKAIAASVGCSLGTVRRVLRRRSTVTPT
jgi:hypothetical protein